MLRKSELLCARRRLDSDRAAQHTALHAALKGSQLAAAPALLPGRVGRPAGSVSPVSASRNAAARRSICCSQLSMEPLEGSSTHRACSRWAPVTFLQPKKGITFVGASD